MERKKIALIYNRNQRVALGERCQKILETYKNLEIAQFDLEEIQKIKGGFDLYFRIDDGDYTQDFPFHLHPSCWWIADTHLPKPYKKIKNKVKNYDFVFCMQKEGCKKLFKDTGKKTFWVPWATDEVPSEFSFPQEENKKWDICFIGTDGKYSLRKVMLEILRINYKNIYIGRAHFSQLRDYYSKARIVANYPINNDINPRIFEVMGAGTLVITHRVVNNGFEELFKENEHLVVFDDFGEMIEKINYYLKNKEERERIARNGFEYVRNNHTYRERLIKIFKIMGFNLE